MSAEKPQSMEERLKAHAARRRSEAGEPRSLHPANRRLLLDEVRRTYGASSKPAPEQTSRTAAWFGWLWSRSSVVGGICVVLFVAGFAVRPWLIGTRPASNIPTGVAQREEAESAPPPATPGPTGENVLSVAVDDKGKREAEPASLAELEAREAPAPTALSFAASPEPPAPAGPLSVETAAAPSLRPASAAAPRRQVDAPKLAESIAPAGAGRPSRFTRLDRYRQNLNSPPQSEVLSQFRFEQSGRTVRIVDSDGSVYSGETLAREDVTPGALADRPASVRMQVGNDAARTVAVPPPTSGLEATTVPGQWYFQVRGTNRTLRQSVEFSGAYAGQAAPADRIVGRAIVGGTNRLSVEAVAE